jgi:PPOX class probable F420-dependent enzyme
VATDLDHVRRLAATDSLAVAATTRADGSVQASVVNAGVFESPPTGEPAVAFVVRGGSVKQAHLRARPAITAVFRSGWEWVTVEGTATLIGPDDPHAAVAATEVPGLLRDVFAAAGGTHDDWDEFDRVMAADRRLAVLVTPERIYTNPPPG